MNVPNSYLYVYMCCGLFFTARRRQLDLHSFYDACSVVLPMVAVKH